MLLGNQVSKIPIGMFSTSSLMSPISRVGLESGSRHPPPLDVGHLQHLSPRQKISSAWMLACF